MEVRLEGGGDRWHRYFKLSLKSADCILGMMEDHGKLQHRVSQPGMIFCPTPSFLGMLDNT